MNEAAAPKATPGDFNEGIRLVQIILTTAAEGYFIKLNRKVP